MKVAPLTDFAGVYAYNALVPVSTYVDRPDLRRQLEKQLHEFVNGPQCKTRILVVHGIGGVGKTQLVLDYVQRYRQDYSAVFWLEGASPEYIQRDYIQVYMLLYNLHLEVNEGSTQVQNAISAVKRWFHGRGKRWLFVIDSADVINDPNNPAYVDLLRYLPDDPSVHVLVTTRDRSAQEITDLSVVEVQEMTSKEAATLFQKQAKILNAIPSQEEHIGAIVHELGYLALAIILAGSYVAATPRLHRDVTSYLPEYQQRQRELLAQRPSWLVHQYGESVLTTWETTFHTIEAQSPDTCHFLALLSFLNPDDIPIDFPVTSSDDQIPLWMSELFPSKYVTQYDVETFFRTLVNFSLIKHRSDQNSYTMHNLVQTWAYDRLTKNQQRNYGYACVLMLEAMTDGVQDAGPVARGRCVPHVMRAFHKISQPIQSNATIQEEVIPTLSSLVLFLDDCGRFQDAVVIARFVYEQCRLLAGEDHLNTLL